MTLRFLTAGESHGPELVAIVEGLPAGVEISAAAIDHDLARRQLGYGRGARSTRIERDRVSVVSGVADGRSTGAPIALRIQNADHANQPLKPRPMRTPRPGHADLAGSIKYGLTDFRQVRERASARETAARVAVGAVARQLLLAFDVRVTSFVVAVGSVRVALASDGLERLGLTPADELIALGRDAEGDPMRCPDHQASIMMQAEVDSARRAGQTLGGVLCVAACGVPAGLGSYVQWDRRLDGLLAQAMCSIPGIKGMAIGPAFDVARMRGGEAHDAILPGETGGLARGSNLAGGVEGGVTNGEPVVVLAAMKPLSSTRAPALSVDLDSGSPADPPYVRSDVCSVPAAAVVGEAMVAWVLGTALLDRFGADRLDTILASYRALRDQRDAPVADPAGELS
jgi:chorismate synthase